MSRKIPAAVMTGLLEAGTTPLRAGVGQKGLGAAAIIQAQRG